jgi:hypothetical protein
VLGQELGGSRTVGGPVVAIRQASQSKEPVGQRLVLRRRSAGAPGPGRHDLDVPAHPAPTGETVFAGQDQLGRRKGEPFGLRRARVPFRNPGGRAWYAAANSALKLTGLRPKLLEVRVLWQRGRRHRNLLCFTGRSAVPVERRVANNDALCSS